MAAMQPLDTPYLKTGVFTIVKKRILWLLVLMIAGTITGSILTNFQTTISAIPLLVTFMPMIFDTGGNSGSAVEYDCYKRTYNGRTGMLRYFENTLERASCGCCGRCVIWSNKLCTSRAHDK